MLRPPVSEKNGKKGSGMLPSFPQLLLKTLMTPSSVIFLPVLIVFGADRILFYTPGGALKRSLSFGGLEAVLYDVSGDTAGIILKETGTGLSVNYFLLLAVADDLRPTEPVKLDHTPVSLSVRDFAAYVLSEERLDEYTADGKSASIDVTNRPEGSAVLAYEKGKVYYLSKSSAFVIEFGDK